MSVPTYDCQMAFGSQSAGYFLLGRATLGNAKLIGQFSDSGFVSLQNRLMGLRTRRGREDALSGMAAGTVEVDLDDDDGALDPDNAASPYYPNVRLLKRVRVTATHPTLGTFPLGYALADDYGAAPSAVGADVRLHATDLFKRAGRERADVTYPAQSTGVRLNALLDEMQWPSALRSIDDGTLTLPGATLGKSVTLLSHLDAAMKAELGDAFIAASGAPTFHDRRRRALVTSRGTFGAGGLAIRRVLTSYNDAGLLNRISVTRTGGSEQVAEDVASQNEYDVTGYSLDQAAADLLPSDANAADWATTVKNRRCQPGQRILGIELDPGNDDTLWGHVLGAEIGDKITLSHSVPGTLGLSATDFFIESVSHEWSANAGSGPAHLTTWGLSLAPTLQGFILGRSTLANAHLLY